MEPATDRDSLRLSATRLLGPATLRCEIAAFPVESDLKRGGHRIGAGPDHRKIRSRGKYIPSTTASASGDRSFVKREVAVSALGERKDTQVH